MRWWLRLGVVSVAIGAAAATSHAQGPTALAVGDRVAAYVASWVGALANVVAQEDFEIAAGRRTKNRVRSDFLFVQDPVTGHDWLMFRDVVAVNDVTRGEREERLRKLFLEPPQDFVRRAREIVLDSSLHVPVVLNPYFAISFLQRHYQPRFRLGTRPAGDGWAPGVVELTFVETARPTLLRNGAASNQDAPARGTAWIELDTGRVLATQMQVRTGRNTATVRTTFSPHGSLGIMVPIRMQTQEPEGEATYTNFRRFNVRTETELKP